MYYKIKIKDSTPCVGIFELIDDAIGVMCDTIYNLPEVNGVIDGGQFFHRDLVKMMINNYGGISEKTLNVIKKNINNPDLHRYFPRGRVCYNTKLKTFEIYSNEMLLKDEELVRRILEEFDIKGYKIQGYVDNFHYSLLDINELIDKSRY